MSRKTLIWIGLAVGSVAGSWLPTLWGDSYFSLTAAFLSAAGAAMGIWFGYRYGE